MAAKHLRQPGTTATAAAATRATSSAASPGDATTTAEQGETLTALPGGHLAGEVQGPRAVAAPAAGEVPAQVRQPVNDEPDQGQAAEDSRACHGGPGAEGMQGHQQDQHRQGAEQQPPAPADAAGRGSRSSGVSHANRLPAT
jgi:hypothetical protein